MNQQQQKQGQHRKQQLQKKQGIQTTMDSYKKSRLLDKLNNIICTLHQNRFVKIKILSKNNGFVIQNTSDNIHELNELIQELLGLDLQTFNSELISIGFRIREKQGKSDINLINYKYNEPFINGGDKEIPVQYSQEESIQEKLLQKELQDQEGNRVKEEVRVLGNKNDQRGNQSTSKRSNIILNKFRSEVVMQSHQYLRSYEDISLEANLPDQQPHYFSTPLNTNRTIKLKKQPLQNDKESKVSSDQQMLQKINEYKQNYQKCAKLIDNTIIKILNAHRANNIQNENEVLLNQITEIYDIMSDNIENVNYTLDYVEKKEMKSALKESEGLGSPGFKPLSKHL